MYLDIDLTSAVIKAVKELYGADVEEKMVQVGPTKKEYEGHFTLVVFPLLKISKKIS